MNSKSVIEDNIFGIIGLVLAIIQAPIFYHLITNLPYKNTDGEPYFFVFIVSAAILCIFMQIRKDTSEES